MIEKQYRSLMRGPPYHYHPEILTVQYILPCLVASYLELEQSAVSNEAKEEYLRFLHELVKSYEQHEFSIELSHSEPKPPYYMHTTQFLNTFLIETDQKFNESLNVIGKIAPFCEKYINRGMRMFSAFLKIPDSCKCKKPAASKETDNSWFFQKYMFSKRIYTSLDKLGKIKSASVCYAAALGTVLINITEGVERIEPKLKNLLKILSHRLDVSAMKGEEIFVCGGHMRMRTEIASLYEDFKVLSDRQLFHLVYFEWIKELYFPTSLKYTIRSSIADQLHRKLFPLDVYGKLFWCLIDKDWWKLKIITSKGNVSNVGGDLSLIPLSLAKKSKCCEELINAISPSGKILRGKPGAITFFPIKHCRWCGLVVSKKFRLCKECDENLDYPDRNYFCSEKCETECLNNQHTEEHAQFLIMQLNNEA
jgi:hypothetical protein